MNLFTAQLIIKCLLLIIDLLEANAHSTPISFVKRRAELQKDLYATDN